MRTRGAGGSSAAFDVIVVGLGAMGGSSLLHLARRGVRVLGLDRYAPPHTLGSTHGETRIIREAYFEDPVYVPLVQRALELWAELEQESGSRLYVRTGGLMVGPPAGMLVAGARSSVIRHGLAHEVLSAEQVRRRFPAFTPGPADAAILEPRAGLLFAERVVEVQLALARRHGAELRFDTRVTGWRVEGDSVRVQTAGGEVFKAARLVIATGPWVSEVLPSLAGLFSVERQFFHWFSPLGPDHGADRCPIALWEFTPGRIVASFPDVGRGVKIAIHHGGETTDPGRVRRDTTPAEERQARLLVSRYLPGANGPLRETAVCLYTNSPDGHFIIDHHPGYSQVIVCSPCSGHGFKFASAVGEAVAALATGSPVPVPLERFKLARFGVKPGS